MSRRQPHKVHAFAGKAQGPELRQFVERLIQKEHYKDALKQARVNFRQEGSPENRLLLERATYLRADELARRGLQAEAKEAATQLLEIGVTDSNILQNLVLLLPRVGLANKAAEYHARLTSPEDQARLSVKLADRAVLRPDEALASMPELRETAQRIRTALDELQAGNEPRALELLQEIPRNSPLAEWRFFVRGLAAFQRGAHDQAAANWERLDPSRSAHSIASALQRTLTTDNTANHDLSRLEAAAFGDPVLGRLQRLRAALDEPDWKLVMQLLPPLRASLTRIDVRLAQRLTECLLGPLSREVLGHSYERGERMTKEFTRAAQPLPIDPHWHRLWALLWEQTGDVPEAVSHWQQYAKDLELSNCLAPGEKRRLQALAWRRVAELYMGGYEQDDDSFGTPRIESQKDQQLAVAALAHSIEIDPTQRESHEMLMALHQQWNNPAGVAAAAQGLLAAFPDDLPTLQLLIHHHLQHDSPAAGLPFVLRARQLKPLDDSYLGDEWACRVALARHHALGKRWEAARGEMSQAAALNVNVHAPHRLLARQAALEFKAGEPERAEEYIRQAVASLKEPTIVWLHLAIEATRYKLPKADHRRFQDSLKAALKKKAASATAGQLAELMTSYVSIDIRYSGRAGHIDEVVKYLRRTTRIKYEEADLTKVCMFLEALEEEQELAAKLANRGLKLFPRNATFPLLVANAEMERGPFGANITRAKKMLNQAQKLAETPGSPQAVLLPDIKRRIALLRDFEERMPAFPFSGGGRFSPFRAMIDSLLGQQDGEDEDDDEYDDEDDFFFGAPMPRRPRKARTRK